MKEIIFFFLEGESPHLNKIPEKNSINGQILILKVALFLAALYSLLAIWLIIKERFTFTDSLRHAEFHKYFIFTNARPLDVKFS